MSRRLDDNWDEKTVMPTTNPETNEHTEFDRELTKIWDEIDLNTSGDNFRSAVKQAVDKYVIGKDDPLGGDLSLEQHHANYIGNLFRLKQRQSLWGKS